MARVELVGPGSSRARWRASILSIMLLLAVALFPMTGMAQSSAQRPSQPANVEDPAMELKSATVELPERDSGEVGPVIIGTATGVFQVFPVQGNHTYQDTFGAPRPNGRTHKGIDIMAKRMTPVVAVAPGVVIAAKASKGISGTFVKIEHDDGSITSYLHLNNDTPGTDDGLGVGIANGIEVGTHVQAGTVIGYVGDSGNAEETTPHLHFAYSPDGGSAMDPFQELKAAEGVLVADVTAESLPFTGIYADVLVFLAASLTLAGIAAFTLARTFPVDEVV